MEGGSRDGGEVIVEGSLVGVSQYTTKFYLFAVCVLVIG